jgi:hypothetical protein
MILSIKQDEFLAQFAESEINEHNNSVVISSPKRFILQTTAQMFTIYFTAQKYT